jgi:hypothetical protein
MKPSPSFLSLVSFLALAALLVAGPAASDTKRWFAGGDKVYIRQHNEFVRVQEPDVHLDRARRSFVKDHASRAADELEKAAAGFAYFAERAAGDQHRELRKAARGLGQLADDVRAKRVGEITNFDRALADARRILADGPPPIAPTETPEAP